MLNFSKTHVNPGEPVTARAWNDIVDGLFEVQALLKAAGGTATVQVTGAGVDSRRVRVTATSADGTPAEALRPIPPSTDFIFPRLAAGAYQIRIEAPGFDVATGAVTVGEDGSVSPKPLAIALTANRVVMPSVFGLKLPEAVALLGSMQLRILDVSGKSLPKTGFESTYNNAPVLVQSPSPGELVQAEGAFLVVAAGLVVEPLVVVPNLQGKTYAQARAALETLGLKINVIK
ncbi:MAG TPA: PASTA domain-containing protein [Polyangiaceae bacterium]|nr:PASTA domain-containing protein [Polyangiaceae bacterium]